MSNAIIIVKLIDLAVSIATLIILIVLLIHIIRNM